MKAFLLTVGRVVASTLSAQNIDPELKQRLDEYMQKQKPNLLPKTDLKTLVPNMGLESWMQAKPGVYALPQDNMPCIVPQTNDIVQSPNAMPQKRVETFGSIPNATPQTGEDLRRNFKRFYAPPSR